MEILHSLGPKELRMNHSDLILKIIEIIVMGGILLAFLLLAFRS